MVFCHDGIPFFENTTTFKLHSDGASPENTLITDLVKVMDGTSHGGTTGAVVQPGRELAIWSNPVWRTTASPDVGNYVTHLQHHSAIEVSNSYLEIGTGTGAGATFTMLPNTVLRFNYFGSSQFLRVNAASTMHYFAAPAGDAHGFGPGKIQLQGAGVVSWDIADPETSAPTVLDRPATLVIHPGATLNTQHSFENTTLESVYGEIRILHGRHVNDIYTPSVPVSGVLRDRNSTVLDRSIVKSFVPSGTSRDVLEITKFVNTDDTKQAAVQFNAVRTSFINTGDGRAVLKATRDEFHDKWTKEVSISNCNFDGVSIHGKFLINPFLVSGCRFDNTKDFAILLENPGFSSALNRTYCCVDIENNSFGRLTGSSPLRMIKAINYNIDPQYDAIHMGELTIHSNEFKDVNSIASIDAAVYLDRCNAVVSWNEIISNDYVRGVVNVGGIPYLTGKSETLICRNTVENVTSNNALSPGAAIYTDEYQGYVKLNFIDNCDRGYVTGLDDVGHLIFSRIEGCTFAGAQTTDDDAILDMAGVHAPVQVSGGDDYSAKNTIQSNNEDGNAGQIRLAASTSSNPRLQLGQNVGWWTSYAENNIQKGTVTSGVLIKGTLTGSTAVAVGPINPNYWGGVTPGASEFIDITYSTVVPASNDFHHAGVQCGGPVTTPHEKGKSISLSSSKPSDLVSDCIELFFIGKGMAQAEGYRKQGYDTLKYFVHKCAPDTSYRGAYDAFNPMSGAVQFMGGSKQRYVEYREWLKSVLYLNTVDPKYYCKAVEAITFTYSSDENHNEDLKSQLAIVKYLLESGKCDMDRDILLQAYELGMQEWRNRWSDTTTVDTSLVQMDTTLWTLEELGLEILRGPLSVAMAGGDASPELLNVHVVTNPFSSSTEIEYTLGRTMQVELTLCNVLGQVVWSKPFEAVEDARTHRVPIGAAIEPGTYFLRVATLTGEVRTVQLIKE